MRERRASLPEQLTIADSWASAVSGGALEAGDDAWGIAGGLPGLGRTPDDDRLLALGFPQMVALTDDAIDVDPRQPGVWPRARLAPIAGEKLDERVAGAAFESGRMPLLWLEALVGCERVARAAVAAIERFTDEQILFPPFLNTGIGFVTALHFIALRVRGDTRATLLATLRSLEKRMRPVEEIRFSPTYRYLELILDGSRAIARAPQVTPAVELGLLMYAIDDPGFVRERALAILPSLRSEDRAPFDLRVAVIGGEPVMRALCDGVDRFLFHPSMVAQLGRVRADLARRAMERLRDLPSAQRWLDENAS